MYYIPLEGYRFPITFFRAFSPVFFSSLSLALPLLARMAWASRTVLVGSCSCSSAWSPTHMQSGQCVGHQPGFSYLLFFSMRASECTSSSSSSTVEYECLHYFGLSKFDAKTRLMQILVRTLVVIAKIESVHEILILKFV